ncbi:cucumber peeling cupredoxin [Salix suchowensis]|nr:cucumber peeling cupredoxin [Salix suchowensis]
MARGYGMALLAAISVAYLIHSSSAQTTYTVGNTTGWFIPPTGAAFYSTWAANKTFKVGDILVFNFGTNSHDVATVTKTNYDACNASSPLSLLSTPPVRITINASGEHYYFCSFPGHCSAGQKLMINVSDASSSPAPQPSATPAPQPSTPTPSSSPSPASTPPASTPAPATSPPASTQLLPHHHQLLPQLQPHHHHHLPQLLPHHQFLPHHLPQLLEHHHHQLPQLLAHHHHHHRPLLLHQTLLHLLVSLALPLSCPFL